ncbi:Photosynthetic NDH subunit of lumenal location 2 [Nymphaea thermarum]|nr:Photosynthetic NDH subunit of lumenal location 2 [Nymphaea thermarum]
MAHAVASMAGLHGAYKAVLDGSLQISGSSQLNAAGGSSRVAVSRVAFSPIRAQQVPVEPEAASQSGRRALLGLLAAGVTAGSIVKSVLAEAKIASIICHAAGTKNSDVPRDLLLPLKDRFFLQPLPPAEAALRAKDSAKEIVGVKSFIDKKAWPYVKNDLRLRASYLRFDLNTVINAKPKGEKKPLLELTEKLFSTIDGLDHAAKIKSSQEAEKYYAQTVSALSDVLAKLG